MFESNLNRDFLMKRHHLAIQSSTPEAVVEAIRDESQEAREALDYFSWAESVAIDQTVSRDKTKRKKVSGANPDQPGSIASNTTCGGDELNFDALIRKKDTTILEKLTPDIVRDNPQLIFKTLNEFVSRDGKSEKILRFLLDCFTVDQIMSLRDMHGNTILHRAIRPLNNDLLTILFEYKMDNIINVQNLLGQTVLHRCLVRRDKRRPMPRQLCKLLISHGANPWIPDKKGKFFSDLIEDKTILDLFPAFPEKINQVDLGPSVVEASTDDSSLSMMLSDNLTVDLDNVFSETIFRATPSDIGYVNAEIPKENYDKDDGIEAMEFMASLNDELSEDAQNQVIPAEINQNELRLLDFLNGPVIVKDMYDLGNMTPVVTTPENPVSYLPSCSIPNYENEDFATAANSAGSAGNFTVCANTTTEKLMETATSTDIIVEDSDNTADGKLLIGLDVGEVSKQGNNVTAATDFSMEGRFKELFNGQDFSLLNVSIPNGEVSDFVKLINNLNLDKIISDIAKKPQLVEQLHYYSQLKSNVITYRPVIDYAICKANKTTNAKDVFSKSFEVLKTIIKRLGEKIRYVRGPYGNTVLHMAAEHQKNINIFGVLLDAPGVQEIINERNAMGETALHICAKKSLPNATRENITEVCTLLLARGANPEIKDNKDQFPKDVAKNERIRELLMFSEHRIAGQTNANDFDDNNSMSYLMSQAGIFAETFSENDQILQTHGVTAENDPILLTGNILAENDPILLTGNILAENDRILLAGAVVAEDDKILLTDDDGVTSALGFDSENLFVV